LFRWVYLEGKEEQIWLEKLRSRSKKRLPVSSVRRLNIKEFLSLAGKADGISGSVPGVCPCLFMEADGFQKALPVGLHMGTLKKSRR
jgi:hypothetical protein